MARLARHGDRTLGDVLRNIPGMKVNQAGSVEYQGKSVGQLYVEGMDLSGDNHGLLTQNISAQSISTIQILEQHQPIRALENIRSSDEVAINLKIASKHKGIWTHGVHAGVGIGEGVDLSGKISSNYLSPKRQHLLVGHYDDTGKPESDAVLGIAYKPLFSTDLRRVSVPAGLEKSRYRDNESFYGSANSVYRLSSDTHFSLNALFVRDRDEAQGSTLSQWMLGGQGDVSLLEEVYAKDRLDRWRLRAEYKKNTEHLYFSNLTAGTFDQVGSLGHVGLERGRVLQRLRGQQLSISNKSHLLYAGRGVRRIEATLSGGITLADSRYLGAQESLSVAQQGRRSWGIVEQEGRLRSYRLSSQVQIPELNIFPRVRYTFALIGDYAHHILEGDFSSSFSMRVEDVLTDRNLKLGLGHTIAYLSSDGRLRLNVPIFYMRRHSTQAVRADEVLARWTFEPRLDWSRNWGMHWSTELLAQLAYSQSSTADLYHSHIALDYRTIVRGGKPQDLDRLTRLSGVLKYRDIFRLFASSLHLSFSDRYSPYVMGQEVGADHNELYWIAESNHTYSFASKLSVSKGYEWSSTLLEAWLQYTHLRGHMGIGNRTDPYWSANAEAYLSVKFRPFGRLFVDLEGQGQMSSYRRERSGEQKQTTWSETIRLRLLLSKNLELEGRLSDFHLKRIGTHVAHLFVDAALTYRKGAVLMSLELQNLTGLKRFVLSSQTEYGVFTSERQLRPRSIMLKTKFNI